MNFIKGYQYLYKIVFYSERLFPQKNKVTILLTILKHNFVAQ